MSVFVIAEAGVNHNGDPDIARALIDAAVEAGADAVKFQTYRADDLATAKAPKAAYQEVATGSGETQLDMLRRLELSSAAHRDLTAYCRKRGIAFLSSPFDSASLEFLVGELGLKTIKVPSGELTNAPLLLAVARSGAEVVLSTGMATLDEVSEALDVLAFGWTESREPRGRLDFSHADRGVLTGRVTLLHCTTEYPAPYDEINLRAMDSLAEAFSLPVGLSDHSTGTAVSIAAVARGATLIEKHFTLDRGMPGPDHAASLEPDGLASLIEGIRAVEAALGSGMKQPSPSEQANKTVARKSLVARKPIRAGETFTLENLAVKRPGDGISPMAYWDVLGRMAPCDLEENEGLPPSCSP